MNAASSAEITTRNDIARDVIAGFAAVTPTLAGVFRLIDTALADLPAVLADLGRAQAELEAVRLDRANLLAAIRATLAADADGECDPLGYLRDELDSTEHPGYDEAAVMSTYRQIRRQTRRARRAGLQPIVVIESPLPVPVVVLLARLAWRYRSEIAPAATAGAALGAGWWLHATHPHWWAFLLAVSDLAASALFLFGGRVGLPRLAERFYAAATVLMAGGWLAVAGLLGPFTSPMPQVLGLGAFLLAVPWWAHRRRRARARVQRAIAAWPDIAKAVSLPGSKMQSATVDLWGWRARLRLARGQTIADATARIPAIESALGTYRGAVRIHPTGDGKANRCELRVLDTDPHAEAVPWPGPSARSITQPIDLGPFEDAEQCRVSFLRRHALFAGTTGSGKSGGLNVLMATLAACDDVVIWAIDLKNGMELSPWAPCIDRLATTASEAAALLADAVAILQARAGAPGRDRPSCLGTIPGHARASDHRGRVRRTRRRGTRGHGRHRRHRPTRPRGRRNAHRRDAAAYAEGDGAGRGPLADGHPDLLPGPRAQRRRPGPQPGHAQRRMARPHPQRARQVPRLRTRAHHAQARPRLPGHRR